MSIRTGQLHRILAAGLLCAGLATTGCPRGEDGPDGVPTARIALEGAPSGLDPRFAVDAYSSRIVDTVLRGLIRIGPDGAPRPDLAEGWEYASATTLRIRLRPGQTFHDGATVTARIVAASLDAYRDPELGSPRASALEGVEEVRVIDERTIEIRTSEPAAPLLVGLATPILHPAQATAESIEIPVGSGPYRFAGPPSRDRVILEAASEAPAIRRVVLRTMPDPTGRVFALETGEADLAQNNIPATELERLRDHERVEVDQRPGWNVSYLGFRMDHPRLGRPEVRRAIAAAIDREAILETILRGTASRTDSLIPPAHWAHAAVTPVTHSPALARELLDGAGIADPDGDGPEPRFRIQYKTSTNPQTLRIAQAVAADLGRVGIEVEVRSLEFGTFFSDIRNGNFEMYGLRWVGVVEPDILHYALHSESVPPQGANRGRYEDPVLDELLERGRTTLEREQRRRVYARAQQRIRTHLPVIPLWVHDTIMVRRTRLRGFEPRPGGSYRPLAEAELVDGDG